MGVSRRTLLVSGLATASVGIVGVVGAAGGLLPWQHNGPASAPPNSLPLPTNSGQNMFPDTSNVWGFGSSTMALLGPHLRNRFVGATFNAQGKGGERAEHICARMGSAPAQISIKNHLIPGSGAVAVRAWNMPASSSLKPFTGTLAGIRGVLSSTRSTLIFTRTKPGPTHALPAGTPFIPLTSNEVHNAVVLLNAGKNNLRDSPAAVGLVNTLTNAAYQWMAPSIKRCVVMTHFVNSNEPVGSLQYTNVQAVNHNILQNYGEVAFDLNAYVLSKEIWKESGIQPTRADLQQQAMGVKATGLSRDAGHLNDAANAAVAARIGAHFIALGYYPAA
ncbi:hypothetical protein CQ018_17875 [Arthrobacter sp. MYb227]|uniref:hypothetical protein n=1 Tax=Arthrobacter sp. MYb227 TaxID=1848601 RepID=UPI000CFD1632|nr:hypothetical protein [Arthrobacter sp. MYb227]PQZ87326.1 hypothetical protein CQ018_17875 [Arthrobacter sp. MYb227]